jgi:hypothetical protein
LKKEDEKFTDFLSKLEKSHREKGGLPLTSYLIMPVQRVPRYELLLRVSFIFLNFLGTFKGFRSNN